MSYFEDYNDMFTEPSKAEQIIEGAKVALLDALTAVREAAAGKNGGQEGWLIISSAKRL